MFKPDYGYADALFKPSPSNSQFTVCKMEMIPL